MVALWRRMVVGGVLGGWLAWGVVTAAQPVRAPDPVPVQAHGARGAPWGAAAVAAAAAAGLPALRKRPAGSAPVVVLIALNEGTETTDLLVPHAVLQRAGVATVEVVAPRAGRVQLMPALEVSVQRDMAAFDTAYPRGADVVIVPALHADDDPAVIAWLQRQAAQGAVVIGICSGARVLGRAGLLDGRSFTGHWFDRSTLLRRHPGAVHVPDRRYAADGPVVTTTGVSASLSVSLALVEHLAGPARVQALAAELGVAAWGAAHRSDRFGLHTGAVWTLATNWLRFWQHERVEIPVADGADDLALAFWADAWSRTYRSQAVAVAAAGEAATPVRLRSGLVLQVAAPAASGTGLMRQTLPPTVPAACQLPQALAAIGERYGEATLAWVALQMEYDDAPMDADVEAQVHAHMRAACAGGTTGAAAAGVAVPARP